jgi:pimeloyl-ACP methyl ester carboxylesterase
MKRVLLTAVALALVQGSFAALHVRAVPAAQHEELPRKGYLGVRLAPPGRGSGVQIEAVVPDTTAADGGIREGDIILMLGGRAIGSVADLVATITALKVGEKFEVSLLRASRQMTLPMTLKERPRDRGESFDVLYGYVVSRGARIRTIVTRPHNPGRYPVLFLIQGLGPTTIDQPLSGSDPYSRILNEFAKTGYVTVRVEKPGIGDSEGGPFVDLDFETELDAFRNALTEVRKYSFVEADKMFIFGHSMGGVFGPILASEIPIKGLAVYGTVAKTWTEYFLENWRRQALLAGADPAQVDLMLRNLAVTLHYLLVEQKQPADLLHARPDLRSTLLKLAPGGRIDGRPVPFWSQLATRNLPAYWAKGNAHALAIWGRHDFIATEADHPLIAEIVNRARPGKGTYVALDGSDHGFRKTSSIEDSFARWKSPAGEFNPSIISTLKEWMEKVQ